MPLRALHTLWFNTGTLCNLKCANCYIESSPRNDRLVYLRARDVASFLDEIAREDCRHAEIGFTGGEPFMNPAIIDMIGTRSTWPLGPGADQCHAADAAPAHQVRPA